MQQKYAMHDPKVKPISHLEDCLYYRTWSIYHEHHGSGHPNLGTLHCRKCDAHLKQHCSKTTIFFLRLRKFWKPLL